MKELGIERNIKKRKVGITGTNYLLLDNEFQIKEAFKKIVISQYKFAVNTYF